MKIVSRLIRVLVALAAGWLTALPLPAQPSNLIAHWSFDAGAVTLDATGNVIAAEDETGDKHATGFFAGTGSSASVPGRFGEALQLNNATGANQANRAYLEFPNLTELLGANARSFTVAAWVKLTNTGSNGILLDWGNAPSGKRFSYWFQITGGRPRVQLRRDDTLTDLLIRQLPDVPANRVDTGEWRHIAWTLEKDNDTVAFTLTTYVDGVARDTYSTFSGSAPYTLDIMVSDSPVGAIGRKADNNQMFAGALDEIFVFDGALTAEEIEVLYLSNGIPDSEKPPQITLLAPTDGALFHSAANGIQFTVATADPNVIAPDDIQLWLNDENVSAALVIGGTPLAREVSYSGLQASRNYAARVVAADDQGRTSTRDWSFDTFSESEPPAIVSVTPPPGVVLALAEITVTFSKLVSGVQAGDLRINGVAAGNVTGSGQTYTFQFEPPPAGSVAVSWNAAHQIADFAAPPHPFDESAPSANWQYDLADQTPPELAALHPPAEVVVRRLSRVEVTFSEPVQGVDAAALLINGLPSTNVTALEAARYRFEFPEPAPGPVSLVWAEGHGITDFSVTPNSFAGGTWSYTLNPGLPAPIVINEIHYDPEPKTERIEFIELYNAGEETVDLANWRFTSGVQYTFPPGASLSPGGYLVLTENQAAFDAKFGNPARPFPVTAFGQWEGQLANEGERLRLENAQGQVIGDLTYGTEFPWPIAPNGEAASMELINAWLDVGLPGSWRASPGEPTPGRRNSVFAPNAPPNLEEIAHQPKTPVSGQPIVISARVADPHGVDSVTLEYQIVLPGAYVPAFLAKPTSLLLQQPNAPPTPNPAYHHPANWISLAMRDDGAGGDATPGDSVYTAVIPGQTNRALVRYRIVARDSLNAEVRAPYADDRSLNFAAYVYDGVPDYVASQQTVQPSGLPYVHSNNVLTSLPVYSLLTTDADFRQCVAYNSADQIHRDNFDARSAFNWSGTFVYDGVVYDNILYRLRQRNDRYGGAGKRSFRFRFHRGNYAQFHDLEGNPYPNKWRTLNTHKMVARGGANFGLHETMNNFLWNLIGVPAPRTHWVHFRVVKGAAEVPATDPQYFGDFYGLILALENYDARFIEGHALEPGNLYRLVSYRTNGLDVLRYQAKDSVTNGADFTNIIFGLRSAKDLNWLNTYVNYEHWSRYHTVAEAVRHYDVQPNTGEHLKNRAYYFRVDDPAQNPLGRMHTLPWDSDTSWGPNWNAGIDFAHQALFQGNSAERAPLLIQYRNTVREFRDLVWQTNQINPLLDRLSARIADFVLADRDRWTDAPVSAGRQTDGPLANKVADMKKFAWVGGSWIGGNAPSGPAADSGISGQQGRAAYLDWLATDPAAPLRPVISYSGETNHPVNGLRFQSSAYQSPPGGNPFAGMEWRIAEVTDQSQPDFDPAAPLHWEWNAVWTSGVLDSFQSEISVPAGAVQPGRSYRARVRMLDVTGRRSSWSAPVSFVASPAGNPPHDLSLGPYLFSQWNETEPAGTYPAHLTFWQTETVDAGLNVEMDSLWTLPYDLTSRSRINGLGEAGFAFINTGNAQEIEGAGFLGAAVLALNTLGQTKVQVTWTGGTVTPNSRVYGLRLQYRVDSEGAFLDLLDSEGLPVEYVRNSQAGHSQVIGPVELPTAALDQPYVELRWRYHWISGTSGARAQLRLDDIVITGGEIAPAQLGFAQTPATGQSGVALETMVIETQSALGERATTYEGTITVAKLSGPGELSGTVARPVVAGAAMFDDLQLDAPGRYTLFAEAPGLPGAASAEIHIAGLTAPVLPRFVQGVSPENNDRVPFAYWLRLEGLLPQARYRYANRIATLDDPPTQDGAGNMILVRTNGAGFVRTTESPRFEPGDLLLRHGEFTTDATGAYAGWFITEPSGNARFTPGNVVCVRLLLNDGQGGENFHHYLTASEPIQVIAFGSMTNQGSAVYGESSAAPRNFAVLFADAAGATRPLAASPVEATGAIVDDRYAAFYETLVAGQPGRWGTIIPNGLAAGVRRIEERDLITGQVVSVFTSPTGHRPTMNLSSGTAPVGVRVPGPADSGFAIWQARHFTLTELADGAISGPLANPSLDGVPNLFKYAVGLEPFAPGADGLPIARLVTIEGEPFLRYQHRRLIGESDLTYTVEISENLLAWTDANDILIPAGVEPSGDGLTETVTWLLPIQPGGTPRFVRLRVSQS